MPQLTSITVDDGETTPVSHTFTPDNIDPKTGVAYLSETTGVPLGDNKITISLRPSADGTKKKARFVFSMPQVVTNTTTGVVSVDHVAFGDANFTFDLKSTTQERKNLVAIMVNAFGGSSSMVDTILEDLRGVY